LSQGYVRPSRQNVDYLPPLFLAALSSLPAPALPWPSDYARRLSWNRYSFRSSCQTLSCWISSCGADTPCRVAAKCSPRTASLPRPKQHEAANSDDRAVSDDWFGLPAELFLGILSTSSGSTRSISGRAIRSIKVAVVRPRHSASIAAVSTF
jgi:hypothetical protein